MLWLLSATAHAHDLKVERSIIAQVHATKVQILVIYNEAPGDRSERFMAKYDVNRNARIDGSEVLLATPEISRLALLGLEFEVEGEKPKMLPPEVKFENKPGKPVSAAILLTYELDAVPQRTLHIRQKPAKGLPETTVAIEAGEGLTISNSSGAASTRTTAPLRLTPGDKISVTFAASREPPSR